MVVGVMVRVMTAAWSPGLEGGGDGGGGDRKKRSSMVVLLVK